MSEFSRTLAVVLLATLLVASCASPSTASATPRPSVTSATTDKVSPAPNESGTPTVERVSTATPSLQPDATLDANPTPILLNPCSLVTQGEAASVVGEPVSKPIRAGGGCIYVDTSSQRHVLTAFAVTAPDVADTIEGHLYLLGSFGLQFSAEDLAQLQAMGASGDMKGAVEKVIVMAEGGTGYKAEKVDGLGDAAMWATKELGIVRQAFVLVARGDAMMGLDMVVTSARDDISLRDMAKALAERMLDRLPERFSILITTPTPAIAITVIPATLLTTTAITGTVQPNTAVPASPTPVPQTPTSTPNVEPPAFSQPVLSSNQIVYGGSCGTKLVTITVKVIDPTNVYGIQSAFLAVRLVESAAGGNTTAWTLLPMRSEGNDIWSRSIFSETDIPDYNSFPSAVVEYYFAATNGIGVMGQSLHRGFELISCAAASP